MIDYHTPLYRPPSEGENLIIRATLGCSYNHCTFCSMYRGREFVARPLTEVLADLDESVRQWPDARRIFLADGDALTLPTDQLLAILHHAQGLFPRLQRVSCYATPVNLLRKGVEELTALQQAGLRLLYFGIESGSQEILRRIRKGATAEGMVQGLQRAADAGIKVSATVILGLGGEPWWREHIDATAQLVNRAPLSYLSTLQLHLDEGALAGFQERFEAPFQWQDDRAILQEQRRLIEQLMPPKPLIFRSNHASNALALAGTLPKDRQRLLAILDGALDGEVSLRPTWSRGL